MKSIIILLMLVGIICVVIGYIKSNQQCPPPVVEFRYLPQTFEQQQDLPTPVMSIFGKMFNSDSAWQQTQGFADNVMTKKLAPNEVI